MTIWRNNQVLSIVCVCVCVPRLMLFVIVFIYVAFLLYLHMISFFVCLSSFDISCKKHYVGERNPPNRAKKSSSLRNPTYHVGNIIWATVNRAGGPTASCKQECISLFWGWKPTVWWSRNPAITCLTCMKPCKYVGYLPYQLVQDFFHQQYVRTSCSLVTIHISPHDINIA